MLIVLFAYAVVVYLVFVRHKLLPWNLISKSFVGLVGVVIGVIVIGALNYLAPSGRVTILGPTISMTPNVSGTVVSVDVASNTPVKKGDILFSIDKAPFEAEVERLEAALREAETVAQQLSADLDGAGADIEALEEQIAFGMKRRDDIVRLAERGATRVFDMQQAVSTVAQLQATIRAAKARRRRIEARISSQVNGVDSAIAQAVAALKGARWKLSQTDIRAPSDGVVTALTLRPGARAAAFSASVAFLPDRDKALAAVFPQTGRHLFEVGSVVQVALRSAPGESFETTVTAILLGTAEGTIPTSGFLPSINQLLGTSQFVVRLNLPDELPEHVTALGTTGSAVMISERAGPIAPLARILFWLSTMTNYL